MSEHRFADAISCFQVAWEQYPLQVTASFAEALVAGKRMDEAERLLRQTLVANPRYAQSQSWRAILGSLLVQENRCLEAVSVYQEALQVEPSYAEVHVRLGQALYCAGRGLNIAETEIRHGITLAPSEPLGYFALGMLYETEGRYAEAEVWLSRATDRSPSDPWVWVTRGENALLSGNVPLAIQVLEQGAIHFPDFASTYVVLARAYRAAGDSTKAVTAIEEATSLVSNADVWVTAGQIYEWAQQPDDALRAYRSALELDPSNSVAQDAVTRLGQH